MRTIIAGSRIIRTAIITESAISMCGWRPTVVLCGMAKGPDEHGEAWAERHGIPVERYIPDWKGEPRRAGILRNAEMGDAAEALIAVWDGVSPGTRHMIEYATARGLRVFVHRTDAPALVCPPPPPPAPPTPRGDPFSASIAADYRKHEVRRGMPLPPKLVCPPPPPAHACTWCAPGEVGPCVCRPEVPVPEIHCPNCGDIGGPCGPGSDCFNDALVCPPPPPPPAPDPSTLRYGHVLRAGLGVSTVLADMDFETYSEAGYVWDAAANNWTSLPGAAQGKKGLPIVGSAAYAEHPTAEVLTFAYDLKDGRGRRRWRPGQPNPTDLFEHLASGRLVEAWNVPFEHHIWTDVCVPKYGWPALPVKQLRCAMAKARAHALPGSLDLAASVLGTPRKDPEGDRLMKKFSMPRKPTKANPTNRLMPADDPVEFERYHDYNEQDIVAEAAAAARIPDLSATELEFWQVDQEINRRGVQVDRVGVSNCIAIVNQAHVRYNAELQALTGGTVARASELEKLKGWLGGMGLHVESLDADGIEAELADLRAAIKNGAFLPRPPGVAVDPKHARYYLVKQPTAVLRALEIREAIGSAAVKKLFSLNNQMTRAGRVHDLFAYHGARTGRPTGSGPQPTNFPNSGPETIECQCGRHHGKHRSTCPWCGAQSSGRKVEWCPGAVEDAMESIATRSLSMVEMFFGDAMAVVSGCLRGLFIAKPGHRLISSDYSAIEAVGLAMLAGEQWRIDVFRTHGKIYEAGAAAITGVPFKEFMKHAGYTDEQLMADEWWKGGPATAGKHHPLRKTVGKVSELACFGGETQVLTDSGYVDICRVTPDAKLWDGKAWVSHDGVINKGVRRTIVMDGVAVTPNHPVALRDDEWVPARKVCADPAEALRYGKYQRRMCDARPMTPARGGAREVYDVLNAGPNHRFTIRTTGGHMVVHNSGYGGWIGAWKAFGADEFFTDDEIKKNIIGWRNASPAVVDLWGGQHRGLPWEADYRAELFGVEGAAILAVQNPGQECFVKMRSPVAEARHISFIMQDDVLYCKLQSGRLITYHRPRLTPSTRRAGEMSLSYEGYNTNPKGGAKGWVRMDTYGPKLVENINQAETRDIHTHGMVALERAGYPIVLHVYDEVACEVPDGFGSVAELEAIMMDSPAWAKAWPVRAAGGWEGMRYRK